MTVPMHDAELHRLVAALDTASRWVASQDADAPSGPQLELARLRQRCLARRLACGDEITSLNSAARLCGDVAIADCA